MLLGVNNTKDIFHIGNDHEISINDLFFKINSFYDGKLNKCHKKGAEGSTQRRCPSIEKMKQLGYEPKIDIDAGLKKTFDFYRNFKATNSNPLL